MKNKIKNSEVYLNSVLGKENSFSVPKNYFNDLEKRFSNFLIEDKISNKKVFLTPNSYFDTLEDKIIPKVTLKEKNIKIISLKQRIYKVIPFGIAASILLFISVNYFNNFNTEVSFDNLALSDIETWILDNSSEITSQDIVTFIPTENINTNVFEFTTLNDKDIEDYIIYNDNTSILNEIN
jgi:hypothetical protein